MADKALTTRAPENPAQIIHIGPKGCPQGVNPRVWRKAIHERLESILDEAQALIDYLDDTTPDPDLEPNLGSAEIPPDRLVRGGPYGWHREQGTQEDWAEGNDDDREETDEDGGDILDEPHDAQDEGNDEPDSDDEPSMGWSNPTGGIRWDAAIAPRWTNSADCEE